MFAKLAKYLEANPATSEVVLYMTTGSYFRLARMVEHSDGSASFVDANGAEYFISESSVIGIEIPTATSPGRYLN